MHQLVNICLSCGVKFWNLFKLEILELTIKFLLTYSDYWDTLAAVFGLSGFVWKVFEYLNLLIGENTFESVKS